MPKATMAEILPLYERYTFHVCAISAGVKLLDQRNFCHYRHSNCCVCGNSTALDVYCYSGKNSAAAVFVMAVYRVGHKKPSPYMSANYVFQE